MSISRISTPSSCASGQQVVSVRPLGEGLVGCSAEVLNAFEKRRIRDWLAWPGNECTSTSASDSSSDGASEPVDESPDRIGPGRCRVSRTAGQRDFRRARVGTVDGHGPTAANNSCGLGGWRRAGSGTVYGRAADDHVFRSRGHGNTVDFATRAATCSAELAHGRLGSSAQARDPA